MEPAAAAEIGAVTAPAAAAAGHRGAIGVAVDAGGEVGAAAIFGGDDFGALPNGRDVVAEADAAVGVIVVIVRESGVAGRPARRHAGGLIRPGILPVVGAEEGRARTSLGRIRIATAFAAVVVAETRGAVDRFSLIVVRAVVLLVPVHGGRCAHGGSAARVGHGIGIGAVVVVRVVAAGGRDGCRWR